MKSDDKDNILGLLLVIPSIIIHGWVITLLWKWFVVYQFELPEITIPTGIGLSLLVHNLAPFHVPKPENQPSSVYSLGVGILVSLFTLTTGWVLTFFM
jgi:hypothetical protein